MTARSAPPTPAAELAADSPRVMEATALAWSWLCTQTRKGRSTSYMSHLLQVAGLVVRAGGGSDAVVAALLHDALEDAPDPAARREREGTIEGRFGADVLRIVLDCTDTTPAEAGASKGPWRARKERYLEQLRAAGDVSLLVAACDKRQNLGDLVADLRHEGPATLERFNAGPAEQLWYFEALAETCRTAIPGALAAELDALVADFRTLSSPTDR